MMSSPCITWGLPVHRSNHWMGGRMRPSRYSAKTQTLCQLRGSKVPNLRKTSALDLRLVRAHRAAVLQGSVIASKRSRRCLQLRNRFLETAGDIEKPGRGIGVAFFVPDDSDPPHRRYTKGMKTTLPARVSSARSLLMTILTLGLML